MVHFGRKLQDGGRAAESSASCKARYPGTGRPGPIPVLLLIHWVVSAKQLPLWAPVSFIINEKAELSQHFQNCVPWNTVSQDVSAENGYLMTIVLNNFWKCCVSGLPVVWVIDGFTKCLPQQPSGLLL